MSAMVARVAMAIFNAMPMPRTKDRPIPAPMASDYLELARAALAAKPTEAMVCAGDEAIIAALNEHPQDPQMRQGTPAEKCWRAMVGIALGTASSAAGARNETDERPGKVENP